MFRMLAGIVILFLTLSWPELSYSHSPGQPPIFKVNGTYAELYHIPSASIENFELPHDVSSAHHYLNDSIDFEFDQSRLPALPEVIAKTNFSWEFGDGTTGTGLKNSHTYTKPGSYVVKVLVDDGTTPEPQLIQSTLVNILPSPSYQPPKAVIKINGQTYDSTLNNVVEVPFDRPITFDATASQSPSSQIISYYWDFGDQTSSDKAVTQHTYQTQQPLNVVLRVTDNNGIFGDYYVSLHDQKQSSGAPAADSDQPSTPQFWLLPILAIPLVALIWYFKFKRSHSR